MFTELLSLLVVHPVLVVAVTLDGCGRGLGSRCVKLGRKLVERANDFGHIVGPQLFKQRFEPFASQRLPSTHQVSFPLLHMPTPCSRELLTLRQCLPWCVAVGQISNRRRIWNLTETSHDNQIVMKDQLTCIVSRRGLQHATTRYGVLGPVLKHSLAFAKNSRGVLFSTLLSADSETDNSAFILCYFGQ